MDPIRQAVFASVARGCGFGILAIFTTVIGLSFDPLLAARSGGVLTLLMAAILLLKGWRAPLVDHRHTEAWLMLEPARRPPADYAQRVTAAARRETFLRFASSAAALSAVLFALAVVIAALR